MFPEYKNLRVNTWNSIILTPRQHYIAHAILAKTFAKEMHNAFVLMRNRQKNIGVAFSRQYEISCLEHGKYMSSKLAGKQYDEMYGKEKAVELKKLRSVQLQKIRKEQIDSGKPNPMQDKKHQLESIEKMKMNNKSPRKGSFWITNFRENKKIYSNYVLPEGWVFGRKIKLPK